ncbi:hypothetical protein SprV_0501760400 [Sparganum proliferum]
MSALSANIPSADPPCQSSRTAAAPATAPNKTEPTLTAMDPNSHVPPPPSIAPPPSSLHNHRGDDEKATSASPPPTETLLTSCQSSIPSQSPPPPARILSNHDVDSDDWYKMIETWYLEHRGQSPQEAMLFYLQLAQDLEAFGAEYFEIRNRRGTDLLLGIDAIGLAVYKPPDK